MPQAHAPDHIPHQRARAIRFDPGAKAWDATDWADYAARHDRQGAAILAEFQAGRATRVAWPTVRAARLKRIWRDFAAVGFVRDEKGLHRIADSVLDGIARLRFATEVGWHTALDPAEVTEALGFEFTPRQITRLNAFLVDARGSWLLSDYGLPQLEVVYPSIRRADSAEQLLFAVDRALNIAHQRSDLAAMFVEGGHRTMDDVSGQIAA